MGKRICVNRKNHTEDQPHKSTIAIKQNYCQKKKWNPQTPCVQHNWGNKFETNPPLLTMFSIVSKFSILPYLMYFTSIAISSVLLGVLKA